MNYRSSGAYAALGLIGMLTFMVGVKETEKAEASLRSLFVTGIANSDVIKHAIAAAVFLALGLILISLAFWKMGIPFARQQGWRILDARAGRRARKDQAIADEELRKAEDADRQRKQDELLDLQIAAARRDVGLYAEYDGLIREYGTCNRRDIPEISLPRDYREE